MNQDYILGLIIVIALIRDGILLWRAIGPATPRPPAAPLPLPLPHVAPSETPQPPSSAKPAAPSPASAPPAASSAVITPGLIEAVKKLEGFTPHAFGDYKQTSIGYGTRAKSGETTITEADASARLNEELQVAEAAVEHFVPGAPAGVKQALTSFTFNTGTAWMKAGLGEKVKGGDYEGAKTNFLEYVHAGGNVLKGLVDRRHTEVAWFDHPI